VFQSRQFNGVALTAFLAFLVGGSLLAKVTVGN